MLQKDVVPDTGEDNSLLFMIMSILFLTSGLAFGFWKACR